MTIKPNKEAINDLIKTCSRLETFWSLNKALRIGVLPKDNPARIKIISYLNSLDLAIYRLIIQYLIAVILLFSINYNLPKNFNLGSSKQKIP